MLTPYAVVYRMSGAVLDEVFSSLFLMAWNLLIGNVAHCIFATSTVKVVLTVIQKSIMCYTQVGKKS